MPTQGAGARDMLSMGLGSMGGMLPRRDVDGLTLHMVKTSNATYGHYGEMAGGQPWVVL